MNHVIFLSGGLGSFETLCRVVDSNNNSVENVFCLFTDTLIEDKDLYLFLLDTISYVYKKDLGGLRETISSLPEVYEDAQLRKDTLTFVAEEVERQVPNFIWRNTGRDVWDIFFDEALLGNSRLARCSHVIKQQLARDLIEERFSPEDTTLYLGIDWSEEHRVAAPKRNWLPYIVEFPLCEKPLVTNSSHIEKLNKLGIPIPRLYDLGFSHNNCGSFCVRAGQGHFANMLDTLPELFDYHMNKELEWQETTGKEFTILRKTRKGVRHRYPLHELKADLIAKREVDLLDIGGCGCFVDVE